MPRLLVDTAVLSGHANALPLEWLGDFELLPFSPRDLTPQTPGATTADALLVRTATRVDRALVQALPHLRAVATLSSGTDHLDVEALRARQISLHTGHGGNAIAVADWVLWALSRLPLQNRRVLIVGVGAVGTAVQALLTAEGLDVALCDPPRAAREPGFPQQTLDQALQAGPWGAVTLHVPKQTEGAHATTNLLHAQRLATLRGAIVLNAARGGVMDEDAAATLRQTGHLAGLAVDTFEGEPAPRVTLLQAADLVTPHIAGHSIAGKLRVAHRAVDSLRQALHLPAIGPLESAIDGAVTALSDRELGVFAALDDACRSLQDVPHDFEAIRHRHRRLELFLRSA